MLGVPSRNSGRAIVTSDAIGLASRTWMAVVFGCLLTLAADQARAVVIVDNLVDPAPEGILVAGVGVSGFQVGFQPFVNGDAAYSISALTMGLELVFGDISNNWDVSLLKDNEGVPGAALTDFTVVPGQTSDGGRQVNIVLTPTSPTVIQPNRRYWIELTNSTPEPVAWMLTAFPSDRSLEGFVTVFTSDDPTLPPQFQSNPFFGVVLLEGELAPIPEPSVTWLVLLGVGLLAVRRRFLTLVAPALDRSVG